MKGMQTVNLKYFLVVCGLLSLPALAPASEDRTATGETIEFAPVSKAAFDRSGTRVSHRFLPGGAMLAEHNGTMGHVTVARLGADGRMETLCTTDENAARAWMADEPVHRPKHAVLRLDAGED